MKCHFCSAENPAQANYCMQCGSPQNLCACPQCGAFNRKDADSCQKCSTSLTVAAANEDVPVAAKTSAEDVPSHVAEAEALARETQSFRQLFAELEQDVDRHLSRPANAPAVTAPIDALADTASAAPAPAGIATGKIVLDHDDVILRQQRSAPKSRRGSRTFVALALLAGIGTVAYYAFGQPEPANQGAQSRQSNGAAPSAQPAKSK